MKNRIIKSQLINTYNLNYFENHYLIVISNTEKDYIWISRNVGFDFRTIHLQTDSFSSFLESHHDFLSRPKKECLALTQCSFNGGECSLHGLHRVKWSLTSDWYWARNPANKATSIRYHTFEKSRLHIDLFSFDFVLQKDNT